MSNLEENKKKFYADFKGPVYTIVTPEDRLPEDEKASVFKDDGYHYITTCPTCKDKMDILMTKGISHNNPFKNLQYPNTKQ